MRTCQCSNKYNSCSCIRISIIINSIQVSPARWNVDKSIVCMSNAWCKSEFSTSSYKVCTIYSFIVDVNLLSQWRKNTLFRNNHTPKLPLWQQNSIHSNHINVKHNYNYYQRCMATTNCLYIRSCRYTEYYLLPSQVKQNNHSCYVNKCKWNSKQRE